MTCWPLALALLVCGAGLPGDWPGWRGPDRTGVSTETGLRTTWPKDGPPLAWTATGLGNGYSTPSVAAGRLYVMGSRDGEEYVHALDAASGKLQWSTKVGKIGENRGPSYPGPRSTPTVVGDRLYALGSDGDLVCLECATGKIVWHRHLEKEFQGNRGTWAYCESVLLDGDLVVCTPGGPIAALLALDRRDGKVIWKSNMGEGNPASYASPIVAWAGKRKLYVQFMGGAVVGVDALTGKPLWRYRRNVGGVNAATPIFHDGCVFTSAAGNDDAGGDALLRLVETPRGVEAKQVYLKSNLKNFHGGVLRLGEQLYGTGSVGLVCLDFRTGDVRWRHRSIGQGSLVAAAGHPYLRNTNGQVALVEASPAGYREKGRLRQPKRSRFPTFAHPVVAGGRLYLRDDDFLFAFDLQQR